ncbi:MAG TPA: DEAD/DEAH box helicase, partial [Frankiaceae bacterium]|nr:DEAD/DEAH box helicase [Frankiaceae bacterium]
IVVERFRDELGDWRLTVHSLFGAQVNAPWALALTARLRERYGVDVQSIHSDDGIVLRLPEADEPPGAAAAVFAPDEVEPSVQAEVGGSVLFASRFRECAARALLLPRRSPGRRTPLWQQRQRGAQLLQVASQFGSFPVVLETMRECLQDVFDVPGLVGIMREVESRAVRVVEVETPSPSPFARSLLFGYVGAFMYEGDAPLAERRAQALSLDTALLAELLGQAELRDLIDPEALAEVEAELQRLPPDRHARDLEGVADLLRVLGDLTTAEALARGATPRWLAELEETRRALRVRVAGEERWLPVEDAARVRDALGVPLPVGVPDAFLEPVHDPLGDLVARYARTHGPFEAHEVASRLGLGVAVVTQALQRLSSSGRVVRGELRPGGAAVQWCDADVLRGLRRRTLARLRKEVEPVPVEALARFLPAWQSVGTTSGRGFDGLLRAIEQLQGAVVPAGALERLVLPSRVVDYTPALLDELCAAGEVLWAGAGGLPGDGWMTLLLTESAPSLLSPPDQQVPLTPLHLAVLDALAGGQALFFRTLSDRLPSPDDGALVAALWDLVWAGYVTNDTLTPLRALIGSAHRARPVGVRGARRGSRYGRTATPVRSGPPAAAGRWSLLPEREPDPTRRAHAMAETLLDRHGVLTRGAVAAEQVPGGFAAVYQVLKAYEESGRCRRGYFVEGLGAAQFAAPGAVDRMRGLATGRPSPTGEHLWTAPVPGGWQERHRDQGLRALVLAATDPANPYGAALPWPQRPMDEPGRGGSVAAGHRPGRKAGALVVLVDGTLVLYVERGGRSLLSWTEDPARLRPAADALALAVREGALGRLAVERADGESVLTSQLGRTLEEAGFRPTPRGLRLRG